MKNEIFKNCLFSILFLDELNVDIENFLFSDKDLSEFFINKININNETNQNNPENEVSFFQFFSEHYSYYFILTLIENNNIIYSKYGKLYPQLSQIMENGKELSNELSYGSDNHKEYTYEEKIQKLHEIIDKFLEKDDLNNMKKYHEFLSKATGLLIGIMFRKKLEERDFIFRIILICFIINIDFINKELT